jgi:hypothetical protein
MESPPPLHRVSGALAFVAELHEFALECAATGVWDDDLAARRRQREEMRGSEYREQPDVKAL